MGRDLHPPANPWLILPRAVYAWLFRLSVLAPVLVSAGAVLRAPTYAGTRDSGSAGAICEHQPDRLQTDGPVLGCFAQLDNRAKRFTTLVEELATACDRRGRLYADLKRKTEPSTRQTLREEEAEIQRLFTDLRELTGPAVWSAVLQQSVALLVTVLLAWAAILFAGWHARGVGVKPMKAFAPARRVFRWSTGVTLGWAALIASIESFDPSKTGFDWSSYCLAGPLRIGPWSISWLAGHSFWLEHATLAVLSAIVGLQIVTGWHVTQPRYVPRPDPTRPGWNVLAYATFLQIWCFSVVVMVGLVAAIWIRGLVSSRTNVEAFFIGFGALPSVGWLVARFLRNARLLRRRCEQLRAKAADPEKLPPDPTDGLLSVSWWKVPTLFVSAYTVASALLQWGGLGKLFGSP